ncbi:8248_t:CDS:1, partial [Ambispora leptoticha]
KNGAEVCHKCTPCAKCGKEEAYGRGPVKYENTNDNPSGRWVLAYCSAECFNGNEEPSLPKKEPREVDNCNYCGRLTEVKFGNTNTEKTFCSRDCYVAAGNQIQKGKCRIAGCSQEAYYECMDLCLPHSKPCRGGKIKPNGRVCNAAMGADEGDICEFCKDQTETYRPNPATPASQPITNSESKDNQSDSSVK